MSSSFVPLQPARLERDESGRPYSARYGDVYQPALGGVLRQAREVFLAGNGLPARWQGRDRFTVCETGFGLGVNFLALWEAWRVDPRRSARLHVVSLEAHPLPRDELVRAHADLPPEAAALAAQLARQWPALLPGLHRLEFEGGALTLTLGFGLAGELASRLCVAADAFFLDGFAPARNPEMWRPELIGALARLAAPGATAATWCSAGEVRRALQDAGFEARRVAGSEGKWHVTQAVYRGPGRRHGASLAGWAGWPDDGPGEPGGADVAGGRADLSAAPSRDRRALIVGGGLAGAGVAQSLALRGWQVQVFDPALVAGRAGTHVGHPAAALTPVIARDDNARARLSRAGSARAQARWLDLPGEAAPRRCGTVQLARDDARAADTARTLEALSFPEDWARWLDRDEARRLTGLPLTRGGVHFRDGLLVRPDALLTALLGGAGVTTWARRVAALRRTADGWQALDDSGAAMAEAPAVVLANAVAAPRLLPADSLAALPRLQAMHALAGEVSLLPAGLLGGGPRCIVGGEGYLLPAVDGWCVAGSTYVHGATAAGTGPEGRRVNLDKAAGLSGLALDPAGPAGEGPGWAGWRAVMPGRLPAIGPVPGAPGLWLATGYASRGLSWSALAGDVLGAALENEPLPLERDLLAAIAPR